MNYIANNTYPIKVRKHTKVKSVYNFSRTTHLRAKKRHLSLNHTVLPVSRHG